MRQFQTATYFRQVYFRKPDLDTLAAAFLAGVDDGLAAVHVQGEAAESILSDPACLCLECGGSGRIAEGNLDHHGNGDVLPTAVEQAFTLWVCRTAYDDRLMNYTAWIDSAGMRGERYPETGFGVSSLVSALRFRLGDGVTMFRHGLTVLRQCADLRLDPWDLRPGLPRHPEWREVFASKRRMRAALHDILPRATEFSTSAGPGLALSTVLPGVHGALLGKGAAVSVACRPGERSVYTIAVREEYIRWLGDVKASLNRKEAGWGGPLGGSIIGAPFGGSSMTLEELLHTLSIRQAEGAHAGQFGDAVHAHPEADVLSDARVLPGH